MLASYSYRSRFLFGPKTGGAEATRAMRRKALQHYSTMHFLNDAELKYPKFQPTL
jgi:hypothetical protein